MDESTVLYCVASTSHIMFAAPAVVHSSLEVPNLESIQDAVFRQHAPILARYNEGSFQESVVDR